jgi:hypothetical protein
MTMTASFSWRSAPDLMDRLARAQNHPANVDRDVMTWAALCGSREELLAHVEACEARVASYEPEERTPHQKAAVTRACCRAVAVALAA